jgi:hypothetical protein
VTVRIVLQRTGLVVLGLALAFGLGEILARLVWQPHPPLPRRVERAHERGMTRFATLRSLAVPNVRGIYKGALHETNNRGIRGPNRTQKPHQTIVRIGVGGDSITMGQGVEERDTYVARLEQQLNSEEQDVGFEVLNFGISGLNAEAAIGRLQQFARFYRVDVVVYGFTINDIDGPHYVKKISMEARRARFDQSRSLETSSSHLVRVVGPRFVELLDRLAGSPGSELEEVEYNYFDNEAAAADFEGALDVFASEVAARDGCGLVLIHTKLGQLGWFYPWQRVTDHVAGLAEDRGVLAVETYAPHAGRHEPSLWVNLMDPHPNVEGHRILAAELRRGLDELPPRCLERRER